LNRAQRTNLDREWSLAPTLCGSALVQVFSYCTAQGFRAPLQRPRLVVGHLSQERLDNALSSDHARQRQRDAVARIVQRVDLWLRKLPTPRAVCWPLVLEDCLLAAFALAWQFIDLPIAPSEPLFHADLQPSTNSTPSPRTPGLKNPSFSLSHASFARAAGSEQARARKVTKNRTQYEAKPNKCNVTPKPRYRFLNQMMS
jgi:hypothetical protein